MKKILVFLGIGVLILLIDLALNYDEDRLNIFISDQEVESLISSWQSQVGRSPSKKDIKRIIDDIIKEEILYREALRLNLDLEDRIIKRRLAQKISFLREETSIAPPKSSELDKFFQKNLSSYVVPEKFTFTHFYFSSEKGGMRRAKEALLNISDDDSPDSDPFMLGKNFVEKSAEEIRRDFGNDFAENFNNPVLGIWIGPIESVYGYHIVKILEKSKSYTPTLDQIIEKVEVDYFLEEKQKSLDSYLNELREKYKIVINPKYVQ